MPKPAARAAWAHCPRLVSVFAICQIAPKVFAEVHPEPVLRARALPQAVPRSGHRRPLNWLALIQHQVSVAEELVFQGYLLPHLLSL